MRIGSKSPLGSLFVILRKDRTKESKRLHHYKNRSEINRQKRLRYWDAKGCTGEEGHDQSLDYDFDTPIYRLAGKGFEND